MRNMLKVLVPAAALLGLLFVAACDGDSGGTETPNACEGVTCGACEVCNEGTCATTCTEGQVCDTEADPPVCKTDETPDPCADVTCGACETCTDGTCATTCAAGQVCDTTADPPVCADAPDPCADVTCDPCFECVDGTCVAQCGDCETCTDGACVSDCAADQKCEAGACVAMCPDLCNPFDAVSGTCVPFACEAGNHCEVVEGAATCVADSTEVLGATVIDHLEIADETCCFSFDGGDQPNNGAVALLELIGGFVGDLDLATVNGYITEALAGGSVIILFTYFDVDDVTDDNYFRMQFHMGEDTDGDPANNFVCDAANPFAISDMSPDGLLFDAEVAGGVASAGPSTFIIPVDLPEYNLNLRLQVDAATIEATMTGDLAGDACGNFGMADGKLGGYIQLEQIVTALNQFVAGNCACLGLEGDMVIWDETTATYGCAEVAPNPPCAEEGVESACAMITQYCTMAVPILPLALDLDFDGDEAGDALSIGARFSGVPTAVPGTAPVK